MLDSYNCGMCAIVFKSRFYLSFYNIYTSVNKYVTKV